MRVEFVMFAIVVIGLYFLFRYLHERNSFKIVSISKIDDVLCEYVITLQNKRAKVVRFRGSSTVWHNVDTGQRASTVLEYMLSNIYTQQRWKEQDARKKKESE